MLPGPDRGDRLPLKQHMSPYDTRRRDMPFITVSDGTEIYYTEQGDGQPIVMSHGWPLNSG